MATVKVAALSSLRMVAGNEQTYTIVIHNGELKEWVGIGWVSRGKATTEDYHTYPVVID